MLSPGCYAYIGSARGPGGLRARLARHVRASKPLRWHIDYLTAAAPVIHIYYRAIPTPLECRWAQVLAGLPGATIPAPGFGSSDCRNGCAAHLMRLPYDYELPELAALLPGL
jgi:Uri superfamily endonuclease